MPEYIYEIEEDQSDESEIFIGWIRRHSKQLIRCKDCEYAIEEYDDGECYCDNKVNGMIYIGNDWNHFCSWAKRKEEC